MELEERGAGRAPVSPSASSEMHIFGKRGGGSGSRDASLEPESIPFKGSRKHMSNDRPPSRVPPRPGAGSQLGEHQEVSQWKPLGPTSLPRTWKY